jgi:hypothetical protein
MSGTEENTRRLSAAGGADGGDPLADVVGAAQPLTLPRMAVRPAR